MPESGLRCPCGIEPRDCTCSCNRCVELREHAEHDRQHYCTRHDNGQGAWLAESAFSRRASGTLQSWCRACAAEHARARRAVAQGTAGETATVTRTRRTRSAGSPFDRPFGLEIEVIHRDMYAMRDAFVAAGLACEVEGYNHTTRRYWKIVTDASVSRGYEIVSPILKGAEGRAEARKAFEAIRSVGGTVDRSCGLHVHHDAADLTGADLERLVRTWQAEQGAIDGLVAPSRRGGCGWCAPLDSADVDTVRRLARDLPGRLNRRDAARYLGDPRSGLRYRSLNYRVFSLHGTVEVRQHQGTVNATKALSWVLFGQAYIARCQAGDTTTYTAIRDVLAELERHGLEAQTVSYLSDRAEAFAGNAIAA